MIVQVNKKKRERDRHFMVRLLFLVAQKIYHKNNVVLYATLNSLFLYADYMIFNLDVAIFFLKSPKEKIDLTKKPKKKKRETRDIILLAKWTLNRTPDLDIFVPLFSS